LGQGAALQTGIEYAIANGADYIATFDADGQHNPAEIMPMQKALRESGAQAALGSRFLGTAISMPFLRKIVLKLGLVFTRLTCRLKITDVHNGFRILTSDFCRSFSFNQNRMAHASEILNYISKNKIPYIEFPVKIKYSGYSMQKGQKHTDSLRILFELLKGYIVK
jgi:glycosyltransferase involved in cell wall biosynthesis